MAITITHFETRRMCFKSTFEVDKELLEQLNEDFRADATPETYFEITEDNFKDIYVNCNESILYIPKDSSECSIPVLDFIEDFIYDYARDFDYEIYDSEIIDEDFRARVD